MKRIFIDGGANLGQSTKRFLEEFPNSNDYEIHMFEPSSCPRMKRKLLELEKKHSNVKYYNSALWVSDGYVDFYDQRNEGSSILAAKAGAPAGPRLVQSVDLAAWINEKKYYNPATKIVLKLDIEGAEYEVLHHLDATSALGNIDKLFCEIHGLKCKKDFDESLDLLRVAAKYDLKMHQWCADTFLYKDHHNKFYDVNSLLRDHKKWTERGLNFPVQRKGEKQ